MGFRCINCRKLNKCPLGIVMNKTHNLGLLKCGEHKMEWNPIKLIARYLTERMY